MKKIIVAILTLVILLGAVTALANEKITIGASETPHAVILDFIKEDLKKLGYDLDVQVFSDYYLPNPATSTGEINANYFQHQPFLNDYNKTVTDSELLYAAIPVHYEPFGIYAGRKKSLSEIKDGDTVAVTNDPANEVRGLLLLQEAGLIELKPGIDANSSSVTKEDIVKYNVKINIEEMNAELIPSALEDVDFAVINGNYAIGAGLSPAKDALRLEASDGEAGKVYANYIVVKLSEKDQKFVEALKSVINTQKVYDFMLNHEGFKGGVIPAFQRPEK